MSLFLRTTALMLLMLSRAPAFASIPTVNDSENECSTKQNQVCSKAFRHNLSGLYGIQSTQYSAIQPYNDFDVLYSKAHQAQAELETICKSASMQTNTQALFAGVKSKQRAEQKIALELEGNVDRITDLARATLVANDLEGLMSAYEVLERETRVVKVKNRFKKPAESGYRDLKLLVQLPATGLIAEVQLHLKAIADVKSGPEHKLYEQIQHIERIAINEGRSMTDWEVSRVKSMRQQSRQLYQDAWQPYITTHLQAA
ncbi:phosphoribosylglycinamide formyltransferase [Vibrio sonorensis]|uniref:phosphoribosylglycinamide formyltransferase n=1 Tax=Vibrio sonorensis TaxID=1004316 RepID=UPI0008D8DCBF|nr:phosphoribosylglycinamide formyltransferase [Vibrio sonorensis]